MPMYVQLRGSWLHWMLLKRQTLRVTVSPVCGCQKPTEIQPSALNSCQLVEVTKTEIIAVNLVNNFLETSFAGDLI